MIDTGMIIERQEDVTEAVVSAMAQAVDPRLRQIMEALVRHAHAFAREVRLSEAEWETGVAFLNRIGQATNDRHNEGVLFSDAIGFSTLLCLMNNGNNGASRDGRSAARPVLASGFAADRERRLDRAVTDTRTAAVCDLPHSRSAGPADRRCRGRRLAVVARRSLRKSGSGPGRHEPARQVRRPTMTAASPFSR